MIRRLDERSDVTPCDTILIHKLAEDLLTDEQAESLAQHLCYCGTCRNIMESLQVNNDTWNATRTIIIEEDQRHCSNHLSTSFLQKIELPNLSPALAPLDKASIAFQTPKQTEKEVNFQSLVNEKMLGWLKPYTGEAHETETFLGKIDHYCIRRVLGHGGMGIVLDAWDPKLNRSIAIKTMHLHLAANGSARQRFVREARAAAAVVHANVVAIHSVYEDHFPPYLVMPLIQGETLQNRIDRQGQLDIESAFRIMSQVADGLAAAHAQGLIHRDIKPANILLETGTDRALLTDFGVVRALNDVTMTASGMIPGTPEFMSPEQAAGEILDARSDLFSLGSVLYSMLTGHSPFRSHSPLAIIRRVQQDTPKPLLHHRADVDLPIQSLVDLMLSKNRESRAPSAQLVAQWCRELLAHRLHPATAPLPIPLLPKASMNAIGRKYIAIVMALFFIGIALTAFTRWWDELGDTQKPSYSTAITTPSTENNLSVPSQNKIALPPQQTTQEINDELHDIEQNIRVLERQLLGR